MEQLRPKSFNRKFSVIRIYSYWIEQSKHPKLPVNLCVNTLFLLRMLENEEVLVRF